MSSVTGTTSTDPFAALQTTSSAATVSTANEAGSADRFLKLLVTQMQNQDPLNPMDNAQLTSQIAQINTVSGITQLNATVESLKTQFVQMQALQGASLVGRDITVKGDRVDVESGTGSGGFELASTADSVNVEILNPSGRVVDTLKLGTLEAGRHDFSWNAGSSVADGADYHFRVTATAGTTKVTTTSLMRDQVLSVSTENNTLTLDTRHSGSVAYSDVQAFN